jgi:mRNA interferase MazF
MRRSEIRLVNLDPVIGNEAAHTRPGVIVSNDGANTTAEHLARGVITVVPVTSNTNHVHPFQVLLPAEATGLDVDSKAQAEQARSVAIERVGAAIGNVPVHLMDQVDDALCLHLGL